MIETVPGGPYREVKFRKVCRTCESASWPKFDASRRPVGMLNPLRDELKGTHRGRERMSHVTTACPEGRLGQNLLCFELSWKLPVSMKGAVSMAIHTPHLVLTVQKGR